MLLMIQYDVNSQVCIRVGIDRSWLWQQDRRNQLYLLFLSIPDFRTVHVEERKLLRASTRS